MKTKKANTFIAKYHAAEREAHRLPFVGSPETPPEGGDHDLYWWSFPAVGDYGDGCQAGKTAALAWLKYKRQVGNQYTGGHLQMVVFALIKRMYLTKSAKERTAIRGQIVGFFSEIDGWAAAAARWEAPNAVLDCLTETEICRRLQDAADCGPSKRYAEELRAEASERSRRAAKARWGRTKAAA